jgi:hypothetical protein
MSPQITGLRVAAVVFGIMAVAQLCRLLVQPTVLVAGHMVPLWPSVIAVLVLGGLCAWLWNLTRVPTA